MKKQGRTKMPLTPQQRALAEEYLTGDLSYKELAAKYDTPLGTVIFWVKKYRLEEKGKEDELNGKNKA